MIIINCISIIFMLQKLQEYIFVSWFNDYNIGTNNLIICYLNINLEIRLGSKVVSALIPVL